MKVIVSVAWVVGLPALLLCACVDANIRSKRDALDLAEADKAGAKADSASMPGESTGCENDDRLGSPCSMGEGACRQQGEYVCENGKVVCEPSPLPSEGRAEPCDGMVDEDCDEACRDSADGGMLDEDRVRSQQASDGNSDHDGGPVDAEDPAQYPRWEPTFCEASSDDCLCLRGVCLPADCTGYDPALFTHGLLFNGETPATGAEICYRACQRATDCPAELPVCVFEIEIWPDDAARSKGCFPR